MTDIPAHSHTSVSESVNIDVEPNNVLHTSPETFADDEKIFISIYPAASDPTDIIATAASPLIFVFPPVLRSSTAHMIVKTITSGVFTVISSTEAIARAPNATCERPSPINENRLSTSVTPSRDEHNAISTPTIRAYLTNGY